MYMNRFLTAVLAVFLAAASSLYAQPPGGPRGGARPDAEKKDEPEKPAPELKVTSGLFGVSNHEKDWYFDIHDSLLGRRVLAVTRYVSHTPGAPQYGGEEVTEHMIYWEKATNGNLLLRVDALTVQADESDDIAKAVTASAENPIIASFKPEKQSAPGCTRVKVTSLFEGDNQVFSLNSRTKRQYNLGNIKADASYINSIRNECCQMIIDCSAEQTDHTLRCVCLGIIEV